MGFRIIFSSKAARQLKKLDRNIQEKIRQAVETNLQTFPPSGDVVKLEGLSGVYRLRVGDWRVTFRYNFHEKEVHIAEVVNRRDAYRN